MFKNILNGKVYIGETGNIKRRHKDHIKTAMAEGSFAKVKMQYIHKAIAKHGIDNFEFSILEGFTTAEEALKAEVEYIAKYNSFGKGGYNLTPGGEGVKAALNKKLTNKQVIQLVRDYVEQDISLKDLCIKYDISRDSINKILTKQTYSQVKIPKKLFKAAEEKRQSRDNSKKTNSIIIANIILDSKTMDNRSLANKYNLSIEYIRKIVNLEIKEKSKQSTRTSQHGEELVLSILNDYVTGNFKAKDLAKKYNISIDSVRGILSGQTTRHLNISPELMISANEISKKHIGFKLDENIVKSIFKKYASGNYSMTMLAKEFGLSSVSTIVWVLNRKTWQNVAIDDQVLSAVKQYMSGEYYFNVTSGKQLKK